MGISRISRPASLVAAALACVIGLLFGTAGVASADVIVGREINILTTARFGADQSVVVDITTSVSGQYNVRPGITYKVEASRFQPLSNPILLCSDARGSTPPITGGSSKSVRITVKCSGLSAFKYPVEVIITPSYTVTRDLVGTGKTSAQHIIPGQPS